MRAPRLPVKQPACLIRPIFCNRSTSHTADMPRKAMEHRIRRTRHSSLRTSRGRAFAGNFVVLSFSILPTPPTSHHNNTPNAKDNGHRRRYGRQGSSNRPAAHGGKPRPSSKRGGRSGLALHGRGTNRSCEEFSDGILQAWHDMVRGVESLNLSHPIVRLALAWLQGTSRKIATMKASKATDTA